MASVWDSPPTAAEQKASIWDAPPTAAEIDGPARPQVSDAAAFREGVGSGLTMGHADELGAGQQSLMTRAAKHLPDWLLEGVGIDHHVKDEDAGQVYRDARRDNRAVQDEAKKSKAYTAGDVAGSAITQGLLTAATGGTSLGAQAGLGALQGGLTGLGESKELDREAALNTLTGAGVGAGGVVLGHGVGKAIGAGVSKLAGSGLGTRITDAVRDFAEKRAVKSLGANVGDYRALVHKGGEDAVNKLGRTLLDTGTVTGGSLEGIAERAAANKGAAGKEVGGILQELDALNAAHDAIQPKSGQLALPANAGEGLEEGAMARASGSPFAGAAGSAPAPSSRFNVSDVADRIQRELVDPIAGSPAHQGLLPGIQGQLEHLRQFGKGGDLTFEAANALKGSYDDFLNFDKEQGPAKEAAKRFRQIINRELEDKAKAAAERAGSDTFARFKAAKSKFGQFADATDMAEDALSRRQANRLASPTDYGAGAAGLLAGGLNPVGGALAVGGAAANHLLRMRGNQASAVALDAVANKLPGVFDALGSAAKALPAGAAAAGRLGGAAAPGGALSSLSEVARTQPQALGHYAAYFPPHATPEQHAMADYTLQQTDPRWQRMRIQMAKRGDADVGAGDG